MNTRGMYTKQVGHLCDITKRGRETRFKEVKKGVEKTQKVF